MKYLLVLLVVVVAAMIWLGGRRRTPADKPRADGKPGPAGAGKAEPGKGAAPTTMLACAHCGVHLPQAEALLDSQGRPFCGAEHRQLGPR